MGTSSEDLGYPYRKAKKVMRQRAFQRRGTTSQTLHSNRSRGLPIEKIYLLRHRASFPFVEGRPSIRRIRNVAAGNAAVSAGQANTASCTVYDDENGIHKGIRLNFD